MEACTPLIATDLENICANARFMSATEIGGLRVLLSNLSNAGVTEEAKLKTIANWLNEPNSAHDRISRTDHFEEILSTLSLDKFSRTFILDLATEKTDIELSASCRFVLF